MNKEDEYWRNIRLALTHKPLPFSVYYRRAESSWERLYLVSVRIWDIYLFIFYLFAGLTLFTGCLALIFGIYIMLVLTPIAIPFGIIVLCYDKKYKRLKYSRYKSYMEKVERSGKYGDG